MLRFITCTTPPLVHLHVVCLACSIACLCTRSRTLEVLTISIRHFALGTPFWYLTMRFKFITSLSVGQVIFRAVSFTLYMMSARSWHMYNNCPTAVLYTATCLISSSRQQHLRQEERHRQEAHPDSSCHYDFSKRVDLVAGDSNGTAWRCRSRDNLSTIDEAFADCALRTPPGTTPLWGPGSILNNWADVCGFLNTHGSQRFWKVSKHGAFSILSGSSWRKTE